MSWTTLDGAATAADFMPQISHCIKACSTGLGPTIPISKEASSASSQKTTNRKLVVTSVSSCGKKRTYQDKGMFVCGHQCFDLSMFPIHQSLSRSNHAPYWKSVRTFGKKENVETFVLRLSRAVFVVYDNIPLPQHSKKLGQLHVAG